jgi:hypothetical protein
VPLPITPTYNATKAAALTPLLLVVEDAQWLDRGTANVVSFLARRLGAEPILIGAAVREGEPSRLDEDGIPEIVVQPLPRSDSETLLAAIDRACPTAYAVSCTTRPATRST